MLPTQVPPYNDLLWPALQAVIELGGSASINELDATVIDRERFSPEIQGVLHGDGPSTEIQYRLAWARTYLKGMGLLTNSQRAVWSVTEKGRQVTEADIKPLHAEFVAETRKKSKAKKPTSKPNIDGQIDQIEAEAEADWKDKLLETLLAMSPPAFERLAHGCSANQASPARRLRGGPATAELTALACTKFRLTAFRCSSSASGTPGAWPHQQFATFVGRWRVAATRVC
jgi:restriction system protein